jgi:hypothetical protein
MATSSPGYSWARPDYSPTGGSEGAVMPTPVKPTMAVATRSRPHLSLPGLYEGSGDTPPSTGYLDRATEGTACTAISRQLIGEQTDAARAPYS